MYIQNSILYLEIRQIVLKKLYFVSDMRKACSRDVNKKSVIPLAHPVRPEEVD